jgi:hypothetical protein
MEHLQQQRAEEVVCERREAPLHHSNAEEFVAVAANPAELWQQPRCPQPLLGHVMYSKSSEPNDGQTMDATNMKLTDPVNKGKLIILTQEGVVAADLPVQAKDPSDRGNDANDAMLQGSFKFTNMDTAHMEEAVNEDIQKIQSDSAIAAQLPVVANYSDCANDANQVELQDSVAVAARAKETNIVELPENSVPNTVFMAPPVNANVVSDNLNDESNDKCKGFLRATMPTETACVEKASNRTHEGHRDATIALKLPANDSCMKDTNDNEQRCVSDAATGAVAEVLLGGTVTIEVGKSSPTDGCNDVLEKQSDSAALDQHENNDMIHVGSSVMAALGEQANPEGHQGQGGAAALLATNDATALVKHAKEALSGSCMASIATPVHDEEAKGDELQNSAMPSTAPENVSLTLDRNVPLTPPVANDSLEEAELQIPTSEPGPTAEMEGHATVAYASREPSLHDYYQEGPTAFAKEAEEQILHIQPPCPRSVVGPGGTRDYALGSRFEVRQDSGSQYAKEKKRPRSTITFLGAAISKKYRSHSLGSGEAPITLVEGVESVLTHSSATMTTGVSMESTDAPHSVEYIRGLSVAVECCLDQVLNGVADRAAMWQNAQVKGFVTVGFSNVLRRLTTLVLCRRFGFFIPTAIYLRGDCLPNEKWLVLC